LSTHSTTITSCTLQEALIDDSVDPIKGLYVDNWNRFCSYYEHKVLWCGTL